MASYKQCNFIDLKSFDTKGKKSRSLMEGLTTVEVCQTIESTSVAGKFGQKLQFDFELWKIQFLEVMGYTEVTKQNKSILPTP